MATESGSHGEFNGDTSIDVIYTSPLVEGVIPTPPFEDTDTTDITDTVDDDAWMAANPLFSASFVNQDVGIFDYTTQFDAHQNTNGVVEYSIIFRPSSVSEDMSGWVFNWNSVDDTMTLSHNDHSIDLGNL